MAAPPNVAQTQAMAWEQYVGKSPEDNIHDDYWLFDRFSKGKMFHSIDGGRDLRASLEYAKNTTVASYTDTETFSTSRIDVFDEAQYAWKEYVGVAVMSQLEKAKNQGSGRKFGLQSSKLASLHNSMRSTINTDLFGDGTSNSSKVIGGLQHIIATSPSTGTVGGINRANFSFWRNQQASGAKTTTPFDNLRSTMRTQYNNASMGVNSKHPDFGVTDQTVFEGFESLLVPSERSSQADKSKSGDLGWKNDTLRFKGLELAFDKAAAAGILYQINSEHLGLAYQKGYWFNGLESISPANQTVDVFRVMTIANLFTDNARRLSATTAIT